MTTRLTSRVQPCDTDEPSPTPAPLLSTVSPPATTTTAPSAAVYDFYRHRSNQLLLAITSVFLCYGGGGAMFWFHAIYRGEQGPPISAPYHWLLDSTLGFIALSPALFFLLPMASQRLKGRASGHRPWAIGALFAVITTPGPIMHDQLVGKGTFLAQQATTVFGRNAAVAAQGLRAAEHPAWSECLLQLAVGLPVYILLTHVAFALSKRLSQPRAEQRTPVPGLLERISNGPQTGASKAIMGH
jgi:hypothetical protein